MPRAAVITYEQGIIVIKRELERHRRLTDKMCDCGWTNMSEYKHDDHLAALISLRMTR